MLNQHVENDLAHFKAQSLLRTSSDMLYTCLLQHVLEHFESFTLLRIHYSSLRQCLSTCQLSQRSDLPQHDKKWEETRPGFSERIWTYLDISRLRTAKDSNRQQWTASPRIFPGVLIDEAKMTKLSALVAFHLLSIAWELKLLCLPQDLPSATQRERESQGESIDAGYRSTPALLARCTPHAATSQTSCKQMQFEQKEFLTTARPPNKVKVCQSKIWEVCMTSTHCPSCCPWLDKSCDLRQELVAAYCHNTTAAASQWKLGAGNTSALVYLSLFGVVYWLSASGKPLAIAIGSY